MVLTEVEPLGDALVVITLEFLAVELAYEIFRSTTAEGATGVDIDNHHPLHVVLVAVDRQLNEVGTLKLVGLYAVTFAKLAEVFPVLHVGGRVETHVFVGGNNHAIMYHFCAGSYQKTFGSRKSFSPSNGVRMGFFSYLV